MNAIRIVRLVGGGAIREDVNMRLLISVEIVTTAGIIDIRGESDFITLRTPDGNCLHITPVASNTIDVSVEPFAASTRKDLP
jgi:hypothetical protein